MVFGSVASLDLVEVPRVEESKIPRNRLHSLEWMPIKHLRVVRVSGEFLPPSEIVFRSLPLSVVDERVASGDLVEQDVPGDLCRDPRYVPTGRFLPIVNN